MDRTDIWHWCWRIARIFAACLLAATVLGNLDQQFGSVKFYGSKLIKQTVEYNKNVLNDYFKPLQIDPGNDSDLPPAAAENNGTVDDAVKPPPEKKITLVADEHGVRAIIELSFEKKSPLYNQLIKTLARPRDGRTEEFRQAQIEYLGMVSVNNSGFLFDLGNLEINDQTGTAYFNFVSNQLPADELLDEQNHHVLETMVYYGNNTSIWEKTTVQVNTGQEIKVIPKRIAPTRQSAEATVFETADKTDFNTLNFEIVYPAAAVTEESKPISGILQAINDGLPVLRSLLIGFLYSLPFLLFFVLKRKNGGITGSSFLFRFSDIAVLLLILYIGLAVLNFTIDLTWFLPLWLNARDLMRQYIGYPIEGAVLLMTVFPALIWSNIVKRWERSAEEDAGGKKFEILPRPRKSIIIALAVTALVCWLFSILAIIYDRTSNGHHNLISIFTVYGEIEPESIEIDPLFYLLPASVYLSVLWAMYELYGRFVWFKSFVLCLVILFISLTERVLYDYRLNTVFTVIIALPFIYACLRLGYYLFTSRFFRTDRRNWSYLRRAGLMIFIIALLFFLLKSDYENMAVYGQVANLAYAVGRLGIFALLFVLLRVLRRHSELQDSSWGIPKEIIDVGLVIALSFFFLPSRQWLFVLIVFITAYLLLKNWAIVSLRNKKFPKIRRSDSVRAVIREKIAVNESERGLRAMKKELFVKIGKGEMTFEDYQTKVKAFEETIQKRKNDLSQKNLNYRDLMMLGAVESPWQRGKSAAFYGLLFSLPWMILILLNLKKTMLPAVNFEILSVLTTAALALVQWWLQAFLFGYYYPHLRGSDGMRKGFNFFLLFFIPTFIATVIARPTTPDVWTSHLLWSLQIFIQSMLLGLIAGDYETQRRADLGWRHLVEVHNLSSLTVWGSSVLVAVSAAITTLITTGASSLITIGVKALLPEFPELPKN